MRKPTREEVDGRLANVRLEVMGIGEVILSPSTRKPMVNAVMALFEDKPMSTCNHVSWTLADGGKVVCDGCGLACGLTMELASKPTPKWEEEFDSRVIVDTYGVKDFIRKKLREMYEDCKETNSCRSIVDVKAKWGL